jgi:AraC-like DNA-binding protein
MEIVQSVRLEDYTLRKNELPFVLHTRLQRRATGEEKIANWHENLEIQFCTQGKGYVLLNGERFAFVENDVVVANSGVLHYTATDGFLEYTCLIIDTDFCKLMGVDYQTLRFSPHIQSQTLQTLFSQLLQATEREMEHKNVYLNTLVTQILCTLCQNHTSKNQAAIHDFAQVKCVLQYIRTHFHEKLSLDLLAKIALCDKYALTRIFKKATGQTVTNYINRLRCSHAANMLLSGKSVTETALACGFENFSYFSKTFQKIMGKLPSAYKKA